MKRRNFIKYSLGATSVAGLTSLVPTWLSADKVRIGYYYPYSAVSKPIEKIVSSLDGDRFKTEVHRLSSLKKEEVIHQVKTGYLAGAMISTDLASDLIPELILLAEGADSPSDSDLNSWSKKNEELWDATLASYGIKRIKLCSYGPRRGIWLKESLSTRAQNLSGLKIYSYGLWAKVIENLGGKTVDDLTASDLDGFIVSNLYIAQEIQLTKNYKFYPFNDHAISNTSSPTTDLYFNSQFWNSLDQEQKNSLEQSATIVASKVTDHLRQQDQTLFGQIEKLQHLIFNELNLKKISRDIRGRELMKTTNASQAFISLKNSYYKNFVDVKNSLG